MKGLIAFPITPMDANGRVDVEAFGRLVRRVVDADVDGVGALGSTGSYPYLSRKERRRALDAAVAATDGRAPVLAGIGALRTDDAIRLAQDAKVAGCATGLLAPVSYTPLTEDEVFEHYVAVAREGGLPICIYDNPGTTHFAMTDALIARLSRVDGVTAVKAPAPAADQVASRVVALREATPAGISVGFSTDWNVTEALLHGGDAWYGVLAGLWPEPCVEIMRAVAAGDAETARAIDARLAPVWAIFQKHSSLRVIYAAARVLGLIETDPPRPILPLAGAALAEVEDVMARVGFGGAMPGGT